MEKECKICKEEFDRITSDHTTKSHLKDNLSDTIESHEREQYNHGNSDFAKELFVEIVKLEKQIEEVEV